jgi:hypothetical protein
LRAPAAFGQKRSFTGTTPKVRFPIRKQTIEPIAAVHNVLSVGNVRFEIPKRKKLAGSDLDA